MSREDQLQIDHQKQQIQEQWEDFNVWLKSKISMIKQKVQEGEMGRGVVGD